MTLAVLRLNFCQVYLQDVGRPNQNSILGALQAAAEAHETVILASLWAIVLHHLREGLLGFDGVPFGLLTPVSRVGFGGQPFDRDFWTTGMSNLKSRIRNRRHTALWLSTISLAAFSYAVGPAFAIAIIPRLTWRFRRDLHLIDANGTNAGTFLTCFPAICKLALAEELDRRESNRSKLL